MILSGKSNLRIKYFQWDDKNIEHISRYHVSQKEFEEACKGKIWFRKGRGKRYIVLGHIVVGIYF